MEPWQKNFNYPLIAFIALIALIAHGLNRGQYVAMDEQGLSIYPFIS